MKGGWDSSLGKVPSQYRIDQGIERSSNIKKSDVGAGEFKKALDRFGSADGATTLKPIIPEAQQIGVRFSNHAVERMVHRGIRFAPEDLERLNQAVQKAESKGARDTLVLMRDSALIVSIKNKTVVTVMDKSSLKENVFTNIDSTVVI